MSIVFLFLGLLILFVEPATDIVWWWFVDVVGLIMASAAAGWMLTDFAFWVSRMTAMVEEIHEEVCVRPEIASLTEWARLQRKMNAEPK